MVMRWTRQEMDVIDCGVYRVYIVDIQRLWIHVLYMHAIWYYLLLNYSLIFVEAVFVAPRFEELGIATY